MSNGVKDLKLWQESVALAADVIRAFRQHNRREIKNFADRMMANAADIATFVAEGYSRYEDQEQRPLFLAARRALLELETHLAIARHASLVPAATVTQLNTKLSNVGRLLSGYLSYLERQMESEKAAADRRGATPRPPGGTPTPV
jgi:four helix bundle protein